MPRGNPNFKKGQQNPYQVGRPKGVKNKFTTFKDAIEESFAAVGNAEYLIRVAKEEPAAYLAFVGRIIPKQIEQSGPDKGPIIIRSNIHDDK